MVTFSTENKSLLQWLTNIFGSAAQPVFQLELSPVELARLEEKYTPYYDEQTEKIRSFFVEQSFTVAAATFEYLLKLKASKKRKNGYLPDCSHEIDQILPFLTSLEAGELNRAEIEEEFDSIENLFCSIISHDIGEDFGIFPAGITAELRNRLHAKKGEITAHEENIIEQTAWSMELLTHYRRYTIDKFEKLVDENLSALKSLREGEIVPLDEYKGLFWEKMDVLDDQPDCLQVFAKWDKERQKPVVIVTRYGRSSINTPRENYEYGCDSNKYMSGIAKHCKGDLDRNLKPRPYPLLAKCGDRIQGMATRIAIIPFTVAKYQKYLNETSVLFRELSIINLVRVHILGKNSSIDRILKCFDNMLGCLHTIGTLFSNYHPENYSLGEKGTSVDNIDDLVGMTGTSPIFVSRFAKSMNFLFAHMPRESHPIFTMLRDLRNHTHPLLKPGHKKLYTLIKGGLAECGPEIATLIQRPAELEAAPAEICEPART